jgi:anti-sigma B factor antagonist
VHEASFPLEMVMGVPVVVAPEEIDISNVGLLRSALLEAAADGSGDLVVDMSRTAFCDSSGLNVLVRAHQRAEADGGQVRLVMTGAGVLRIFVVTGVDRVIPIFGSVAEAVAQSATEEFPAASASLPAL